MICTNCGAENKDYYAFCDNCGMSLLKNSSSAIYQDGKNEKEQIQKDRIEEANIFNLDGKSIISERDMQAKTTVSIKSEAQHGSKTTEKTTAKTDTIGKTDTFEISDTIEAELELSEPELSEPELSEPGSRSLYKSKFNHRKSSEERRILFRKKMPFIITINIVLAGIIIFLVIGVCSSDFRSQAIEYITLERSCRWDKVYDIVGKDLPDSEFMTKEMFLSAKSEMGPETISNCQAAGFTLKDTGDSYLYVAVNYKQNNDNSSDKTVVTMDKQPKKNMFFFDKYKINSDNVVVKNIKFTVSKDSKIFVDGIQLKDSYLKNQDAEADTEDYIIDYIFKGKHTIKVTHEELVDHEDSLNIENGNFSHSYADLSLKTEVIAKLQSDAIETVKKYYNAVSHKEDFSELSSCFMADTDIQNQIRTQFVKQQETQGTVFTSGANIAAMPDSLNASTVWQAKYDANNILSTTVVVRATYKPQNSKTGTAVTVELGMLGYRYKNSEWKAYSITCGIGVSGVSGTSINGSSTSSTGSTTRDNATTSSTGSTTRDNATTSSTGSTTRDNATTNSTTSGSTINTTDGTTGGNTSSTSTVPSIITTVTLPDHIPNDSN